MIHWLIQSAAAHSDLARGIPPAGLLSEAEQAAFATLRIAKRQQDWLLGRWTAKQLLQVMCREQYGVELAWRDFQVLNDSNRVPRISVNQDTITALPAISLSHSHGHAFCAALWRPSPPIGADMELIASRAAVFVQDYFTMEEQTAVQQTVSGWQDMAVTAIWSAKEAVLKALQVGLSVDTRRITCHIEPPRQIPLDWEPFTVVVDGSVLQGKTPPRQGWWRVQDEFVLTLVA